MLRCVTLLASNEARMTAALPRAWTQTGPASLFTQDLLGGGPSCTSTSNKGKVASRQLAGDAQTEYCSSRTSIDDFMPEGDVTEPRGDADGQGVNQREHFLAERN